MTRRGGGLVPAALAQSRLLTGIHGREPGRVAARFSRRAFPIRVHRFRHGEPGCVYSFIVDGQGVGMQPNPEGVEVCLHVLGPEGQLGALATLAGSAYPPVATASKV